MSGFILFGGILVVLLATIIWAAFQAGEDTGAALSPEERRDAAIEALRDLELEFRTDKLTPEEYQTVRARLEREALTARDEAARGRATSTGTAACADCSAPLHGREAFCSSCGAPTAR